MVERLSDQFEELPLQAFAVGFAVLGRLEVAVIPGGATDPEFRPAVRVRGVQQQPLRRQPVSLAAALLQFFRKLRGTR